MEFNNDTGLVNPEIKYGNTEKGEKLISVLTSIPEKLPSYQNNYIPVSKAVKDYVDAHSGVPENMVTTDTEQTITGKKVFGTLQATSLTDGTTTKTMTEVLSGTTEE